MVRAVELESLVSRVGQIGGDIMKEIGTSGRKMDGALVLLDQTVNVQRALQLYREYNLLFTIQIFTLLFLV